MRIAVTGASGNVGSALLRALADHGEPVEVVGISRRPPADQPPYDVAAWVQLDLSADDARERLTETFAGVDAVVHLAWAFQPGRDGDYLERLGVGGSGAVLDSVVAAGVAHLVHMSSVGAYAAAPPGTRVDESWPATGVPTSPYSRHKAAVERLLDRHEGRSDRPLITRLRPGLIGQGAAGSALLRYGLPSLVPGRSLRWLPVLPLDRRFVVPVVHADDVARAVVAALDRRAGGAFNLATEPPVTREVLAEALHARAVQVPESVLRAAATGAWWLRLSSLDPGWLDLAFAVPLLDCGRARDVLGWQPQRSAVEVMREVVDGMTAARAAPSPPLRPRSVLGNVVDAVRSGPISRRRRP